MSYQKLKNRSTPDLPAIKRQHSLRWRLLTLLGTIVLMTLFIIVTSVFYFTYKNEQRFWDGRQQETARHAAKTVEELIEYTFNTMAMVSMIELDQQAQQLQVIDDLIGQNPTLLELIRVDANGQVLAGANRDGPLLANLPDIPESTWFVESQVARLYLGEVQTPAHSEPYAIIAMADSNGRVVAVRLRMTVLWDEVANLCFGQTGQVYVVNQAGQIIAHPNPEVVLSHTNIRERPEMRALLQAPNREWRSSYANFEDARVIGVTSPVPGTEWIVITELPRSEAFAISRTAGLVLGGGIIFFGIVGLLVTERFLGQLILQPIEELRLGVIRIGQGDFNHRNDIFRQDEIGQLAIAFNNMANHLQAQHISGEQRTAEMEVIYQASLSLTSNLELKAVLDVILDSTFQLLPEIMDVHIFLYDGQEVTFAASLWADGRRDYLIFKPRSGGLTYTVAKKGEIMVIPDIQNDPLYPNPPAEWHGALGGIPLKIGTRVVGVMNIAYPQPHSFTDSELQLLRLLGDQAAIAIENANLYEQVQQELAERKRAEQAMARARDRALEASRLKTELLAKVSHELRTPLTAILGFSEMIQEGIYGPISDEIQETTAKIIESTHYLTSLVTELLDQAQLEAGKLKLEIGRVAPVDIVRTVQSRMNVLAQAKGLTLTTNIAPELPATLAGDQKRLEQILVNLVSNAIKFTEQGEVRLDLYCSDAIHWAIQVSDTGPGIPVEAQTHIFEPFGQVDGSSTRQHGGTGLGLSIVKQLTTLMGGYVTLKSEIGQGSTFTVFLPSQPIVENQNEKSNNEL
jgi:signal transduction histidine kinase